ncbi:Tat pathway signal sequence domain protein, partial [Streptomyces sp. ID05-04B]|nr:Tat pathway signal sequence domain protein [Streptomyces sp. ID05-04B]
MPNAPRRRDVLKYAGTTGAAAAGLGLLNIQPAAAAPASEVPFRPAVCKPLDVVVFGDANSETTHGLTATLSDTVTGGLGQRARVLNPTEPATYWGGALKFDVAVSPTRTTYVTVRLWGDDFDSTSRQAASGTNMWRLQLFCDGLQVGHQDEGAVDSLDILDTSPRTPGRFFFHTLPLPERLTRGKEKVTLEIRSMGRIWSYGQNTDQLYYKMTTPSRGIYRLYTHTEPCFVPPRGEAQGPAPVPTVRDVEGPEALEAVRQRVAKDQKAYLTSVNPAGMDAWAFQSLAEGYLWSGSPAHRNPAALDRVLRALDGRYMAWKNDATVLTGSDQQWQGFGRVGLVLALLWEHLDDRLDQRVTGSPYEISNPGFEEGGETPMGWEVPGWGKTADADWTRDTTVSRTGSASLRVTASAVSGFITVYSSPRTRVGKGTHTYGAWIRTDGVTG